MSTFLRRAAAVRLLERLLEAGKMDRETLGQSLGVSEIELEAFRSGTTRMPADLRLRLACVVVAHMPDYARAAQRLQHAAEAEVAFRNTTTITHLWAPPSRFRS